MAGDLVFQMRVKFRLLPVLSPKSGYFRYILDADKA